VIAGRPAGPLPSSLPSLALAGVVFACLEDAGPCVGPVAGWPGADVPADSTRQLGVGVQRPSAPLLAKSTLALAFHPGPTCCWCCCSPGQALGVFDLIVVLPAAGLPGSTEELWRASLFSMPMRFLDFGTRATVIYRMFWRVLLLLGGRVVARFCAVMPGLSCAPFSCTDFFVPAPANPMPASPSAQPIAHRGAEPARWTWLGVVPCSGASPPMLQLYTSLRTPSLLGGLAAIGRG